MKITKCQLLNSDISTGEVKPDEQEKVALLNWIREARKMSLPKETPNVDADRLVQPIPDSIATDEAKVALGHDLFFDGRLSGDGSIQCHFVTN